MNNVKFQFSNYLKTEKPFHFGLYFSNYVFTKTNWHFDYKNVIQKNTFEILFYTIPNSNAKRN